MPAAGEISQIGIVTDLAQEHTWPNPYPQQHFPAPKNKAGRETARHCTAIVTYRESSTVGYAQ